MKLDLVGKIKNTQLPRSKALLPLFEAVVNSFQATEEAPAADSPFSINIIVERDPTLEGVDVEGHINTFTITDNGVGFTDQNFDSFFTSDTQYKVTKGGKGLGRFVWLKAFASAEIESHFRENGRLLRRSFQFSTRDEQPTGDVTPSERATPLTSVRLRGFRSPYKEACPRSLQAIGHQLIEHYLPFFMDKACPSVSITDRHSNLNLNLNNYFHDTFGVTARSILTIWLRIHLA